MGKEGEIWNPSECVSERGNGGGEKLSGGKTRLVSGEGREEGGRKVGCMVVRKVAMEGGKKQTDIE
ncbi:MAG: hypothetical protein MPL62_17175 [Alphaproteobacteria bacterium]|nr:hypothetical protein [Alphaproteobacteria bacterium]